MAAINAQPGPSIPVPEQWIGRRVSINAYRYTASQPTRLTERLAAVGSQPSREIGASELCSSVTRSSVSNSESRVARLSGSLQSSFVGFGRADPLALPAMPAFTVKRRSVGRRLAPHGSAHLNDGSGSLDVSQGLRRPGFRGGKVRPVAGSRQGKRAATTETGPIGTVWRPTEYRSFFQSRPPSQPRWPVEQRQCGGRPAQSSAVPRSDETAHRAKISLSLHLGRLSALKGEAHNQLSPSHDMSGELSGWSSRS